MNLKKLAFCPRLALALTRSPIENITRTTKVLSNIKGGISMVPPRSSGGFWAATRPPFHREQNQ